MNRPKIEDYAREVYWERNFIIDMNEYCDYLEKKKMNATYKIESLAIENKMLKDRLSRAHYANSILIDELKKKDEDERMEKYWSF